MSFLSSRIARPLYQNWEEKDSEGPLESGNLIWIGPGFEEVIYQRALVREFPAHGLDFSRQVWIDVYYKGEKIGRKQVDFVVDEVLVEIKAKAALEDVDFVQTLSYLKASGYKVALLLNFGARQLEIKRIVYETARTR
jgi:GxxExxY protein